MNSCVIALLSTGAALALSLALGELIGENAGSSVVLFVAASIAAMWYGGLKGGAIAVVLGAVALLWLGTRPTDAPHIERPDRHVALLAFIVTSLVGLWLVEIAFARRRSCVPPVAPSYLWLACFVVANLAAAGLGQGLKLIPGASITFWPPSGIFVAALLLSHPRTWPWWVAGACAAELTGNILWFHNPLHLALLYFAANTAEALTAALLVRWAVAGKSSVLRPRQLEQPWNAFLFVVLAGGIAPVVGATIIATADAILGKYTFGTAWQLVWLGDGTGLLLSAPLTLAAVEVWRRRKRIKLEQGIEFACICGLTVLLTWLALKGELPTVYLVLPAIVWAAVRYQIAGAWFVVAAVTLTIAAFTRSGLGNFAGSKNELHHQLIALQVFLGVCASTTLLVAGLSARLLRVHRRLRIVNQSLEQRVLERTVALRESEERFRLTLQGSNVIIAQCDLELRYVWIHDPHPAFDIQTVLGKRDTEIADNEGTRELERLKRTVLQTGKEATSEITFPLSNGPQTYEIRAEPRYDGLGRLTAIITVGVNLSERKRAELAVRESEQRLRLAMEAAATGMWDWDLTTNAVVWSPECYLIHGLSAGEFDGTAAGFTQRVHPDDRDRVWAAVRAASELGAKYECEFRIVRPGGEVRWVSNLGRVVDAEQGKLRMVGTINDITERKRAEAEKEESRTSLATIVEKCPFGIYIVDDEFRILTVNGGSQDTAFANVRPLIGRPFEEAMRIIWPEPIAAECINIFRRTLITGASYYSTDFMSSRADVGQTECYEWQTHRITLPNGRHGVVCYYFDATRLRQAERQLKEMDRQKDEFLATLAHELRNPLAPIRNGLAIMKLAGDDFGTVDESRSMMERQLEHMTRLIDDLMDVTRINHGKIHLKLRTMNLADAIHSAVDTSRPLIAAQSHELMVDVPSEPILVEGDLTRLSQAFANLLNNAAKYTDEGGRISVTVKLQGNEAVVRIEDNGVGVAPEMLPRVFGLFAQVDHSLEKSRGGLGIGLNIVKRLVEKHGGTITAESEGLGKGSTFTVRLPIAPSVAVDELDGRSGIRDNAKPAVRRRILIVDDSRDSATSLAMMLRIMGNETQAAHDGLEAVDVAEKFKPDVILMDIGMPKLNGYDACRRIRSRPWGRDLIIVACTGWGRDEDRQLSQEAGFTFHVVKPVDPTALESMLSAQHTA